jgi:hypothetical protein
MWMREIARLITRLVRSDDISGAISRPVKRSV